jgi:AmiR/NasT family two-component response regulator
MTTSVRTVVIAEEACERRQLVQTLGSLSGIRVVAEVDRVCQMGRQARHVEAECVVLDIDRYPLAGTLGLAQARGTFPGARIIVLVRSVHPRYLQFLKESGASCCIDKDDPDKLAQVANAVGLMIPRSGSVAPTHVLTRSGSVYNLRKMKNYAV